MTLSAAGFFARRLDHVGLRLGLPETLLGLLTALAADAPEVSAAVTALLKGQHSAGVGVVVGSSAFNLAAMVGLSAVLAGGVRLAREELAVEGAVGLAILLLVAALIVGWIPPAAAIAIIAVVLLPYVIVLALGPGRRDSLRGIFGEQHPPRGRRSEHGEAILRPALVLLPALAIIIAGSALMVEAAVRLAHRWSVPEYLAGVLVLAVLTSLPNAFTAVRLGLHDRGSALLAETLNSNTINLVAGIAIPALALTLGSFSGLVAFDLAWLGGMTVVTLALLAPTRGMRRTGGGLLVALYLVFLAVQIGYGR